MFSKLPKRKSYREIAPEEIFLDSTNLPDLEASQFEGRVVGEISRRSVFAVGIVFVLVATTFSFRAFNLQIAHGETFADISRNNSLDSSILFATRGVIFDRKGIEL